jgi:hypothetical protein
VRQAGGKVLYTEYEAAGHNVWDRTYANRKFWQWLLAQRREAGEGPAP